MRGLGRAGLVAACVLLAAGTPPAAEKAAGTPPAAEKAAGTPPAAEKAAGTIDQVVERLERTYGGVQDLTARFRQTSTIVAAGQVQQAAGTLAVKRPGKMRWDYTEPEPRLFVTDGKTFWAYSPEDRQVMVQEVGGALSATPLALLMGAATLRKEFHLREVPHAAGAGRTALLELRPMKPLPNVRSVLLEVDLVSSLVIQATVFDGVGNTIVLALADQRLNVGIPDGRFTFTPPAGVQVISPPGARP